MSISTPAHFIVAVATSSLMAVGCGQNASSPVAAQAIPTPRRLEIPADVRPIANEKPKEDDSFEANHVRAQYQQSQFQLAAAPGPRIVDLSTSGAPTASTPIRPPSPMRTEDTIPPAPPRRESEFVPIAMPESSRPTVQSAPVPELPAQPTFEAGLPVSGEPAVEGPELNTPTASAQSVTQPTAPIQAAPPPSFSGDESKRPLNAADATQLPPAINSTTTSAPMAAQPAAQPQISYRATQADAAAMRIVEQRALQSADRATAVAQRGMFYTARSELIQALQFVAQSLDAQEGGARHASALSAGLRALTEARDFSAPTARPGEAVDVAAIASTHRTHLLDEGTAANVSPIVAQQWYMAEAEKQLTIASGGLSAGSQILYRLGRLETAMAAHDADASALHAPQAIVFHQAALTTDGGNWLAANELGVLFARYGQLAQARQVLLHSVSIHPHTEGWQNLATIHRQLGEIELAKRAENERQLLAKQSPQGTSSVTNLVTWVDPKTFAASGGADVHWPADAATTTAAASSGAARR